MTEDEPSGLREPLPFQVTLSSSYGCYGDDSERGRMNTDTDPALTVSRVVTVREVKCVVTCQVKCVVTCPGYRQWVLSRGSQEAQGELKETLGVHPTPITTTPQKNNKCTS